MIRRPPRSTLIVYTTLFRFHQISLESKLNGRQKVKGGNGSNIASSSASSNASSSASSSASSIPLNLGVGCAPSCWPIFGFRNLLGAPRGRRGQFSVQSDNRFSGGGGGVGSLPRAWRRGGVPGAAGAKKKTVRLASAFASPPFWSSDFAGPRRPPLYGSRTR